jgi:hypothetical protein
MWVGIIIILACLKARLLDYERVRRRFRFNHTQLGLVSGMGVWRHFLIGYVSIAASL